MNQEKEVRGRELLAYVREAFAFSDSTFLVSKEAKISVEITNFEDDDTRDLETSRSIELALPILENFGELIKRNLFWIEVVSKRFRLRFDLILLGTIENTLNLRLPDIGWISNIRKNERILIKDEALSDAILISDKNIYTCLLKLIDFTNGAYGGHIYTDQALPENQSYSIQTRVKNSGLEFFGKASIVRLKEINLGKRLFEYKVGLIPITELYDIQQIRSRRVNISTTIHCTLLASNTRIAFEVEDISATGFKASKCVPLVPWLTQGLLLVESNTGIKLKIVRIDKNGAIGMKLQSSSPEERIRWSNFILPIVSLGKISANSYDARALVNVFLEAGGSIAENLAYKRHSVTQTHTQSFLTQQSKVLLRWVNIAENGTVLGHHSSYRVGLNSWFTGDIVGGQSAERKIDPTFITNNFRNFKDFLLSLKEPQKIFGSWKWGHPYWQKLRTSLIEKKQLIFSSRFDHISRKDINTSISADLFNKLEYQNLLDFGSHGLGKALKSFDGSAFNEFLGALDITECGTFYNGLEYIYENGNLDGFAREIFLAKLGRIQSFIIFSQLPNGVSINGVFDCIFVLPIQEPENLKREDILNFYSAVCALAISHGFRVSSLRSFFQKCEYIGLESEMVIFTPDGLEFFCK